MTSLSSYGEDISVPAYQRGFQTLKNETSVAALDVEGHIPDWLTGTLLRVGPGRFEWGPDRYRHWFDGSGMIHKFSFAAGKVGYANRYVRGTAFRKRTRWSHHCPDLRHRPLPGDIPQGFRPLSRNGKCERGRYQRR